MDRALFTTFVYKPNQERTNTAQESTTGQTNEGEMASFQISLPAMLETLQIFGLDAPNKDRWPRDGTNSSSYAGVASFASGGTTAFDRRILGLAGVCRLSYAGAGAPFSIILEETGVTTTCELVTYEADVPDEIPLQRDRLAQKIIMRASWLHDAMLELAATNANRLTLTSSPTSAPYLALSAIGPLGSATVEFPKDPQLLETFQVARRTSNTYKFALIKNAARAMAIASKVSIRGDDQGVLSLQFMIDFEAAPACFVDYRFVPFVEDDDDDDDQEERDYQPDDHDDHERE